MQRFGASQRQTCTLSRFSRTVYRYESIARDQSALEMSIKEIAKVRMHYGAPRVYVMLRREGGETTMASSRQRLTGALGEDRPGLRFCRNRRWPLRTLGLMRGSQQRHAKAYAHGAKMGIASPSTLRAWPPSL